MSEGTAPWHEKAASSSEVDRSGRPFFFFLIASRVTWGRRSPGAPRMEDPRRVLGWPDPQAAAGLDTRHIALTRNLPSGGPESSAPQALGQRFHRGPWSSCRGAPTGQPQPARPRSRRLMMAPAAGGGSSPARANALGEEGNGLDLDVHGRRPAVERLLVGLPALVVARGKMPGRCDEGCVERARRAVPGRLFLRSAPGLPPRPARSGRATVVRLVPPAGARMRAEPPACPQARRPPPRTGNE